MWQQKSRLLLIAMVLVGVGFGLTAAIIEPPLALELPVFVALVAGGGLVGYLYRQKQKDLGQFDERAEQIELRANRASYSTLLVALAGVMAFDLFADITPYISVVLVGLLLGGIVVDECFIEWYRRKL